MAGDSDDLRREVRQILRNDWDPSNAARFEAAQGEYDSYIDPVLGLLRSGAGEAQLIEYLHARELECTCFPPSGTSHLRRVAQRLLAVPTSPAAS